ncbi:MAG: SMP-30/gluconolactonase/LRE family protein [Bacteroidales bacterium]|nr:SMP-30/gluconolactonase/LRE family protein [Bacteroidales bacterium]MCF8391085.1 SMP-30/gluconolactonase/LRE family protein [Bacteroidales bacterium]
MKLFLSFFVLPVLTIVWNSCIKPDTVKSHEAIFLPSYQAELGEGAIWDHTKEILYWIDIEGKKFFRYNPENDSTDIFELGKRIGTIVPDTGENVILALEDGLYLYNLISYEMKKIATPESLSKYDRFNDGKCDASGRLWVGSMKMEGSFGGSFLYKFDSESGFSEMIDSVQISNGIIWSTDNTKMYYIDTPTQKVMMYSFNLESGQISNPEICIEIPDSTGHPDGMTIDENGNLWVALWGGYGVACFDAENGKLIQKVNVPVKNVTSCAFGGKNLDTLFITTARAGNSIKELEKQEYAGGLFYVVPGVKGVKANLYKE